LVKRAEALKSGRIDPRDDNMLLVTTDGRKAALDLRLYDPTLPDLCRNNSRRNERVRTPHPNRAFRSVYERQATGRPKIHTVEKILECLGKRKLNTAAWQKRAGSEKGVPKTQFFQLLDQAKRRPGLSQTPQGKWFYEAPKE